MSRNPYTQVALTYLRRPFSSAWAMLFIGFFAVMTLGPFLASLIFCHSARAQANVWTGDQQTVSPLLIMFLSSAAMLFGLTAVHIKEQFADPRARLMPGFRRAHLAGAAVAFAVLAILLPAVMASLAGVSWIGLTAIAVLWFDFIFWYVLLQSSTVSLLFVIAFFAILFGPGARVLTQLCFGPFQADAAWLLLLGFVLAWLGVRRLLALNEDMPEYHRRMRVNWQAGTITVSRPQAGQDIVPRSLREWRQERKMVCLTRHAHRAADSPWSRVCRWQVGMTTGWDIVAFSLFVPLIVFVTFWLFVGVGHKTLPMNRALPSLLAAIFPVMCVMGVLMRRRNEWLPYEFLLPVSRVDYLRQAGMAAAINQLQLWLGLSVATALAWQIVAPARQSLTDLANMLLLGALAQIGFFGIMVWLVRFRSRWAATIAMILAMQVGAMVPMLLQQSPLSATLKYFPLAIGLFAVMGALLTWDAYRRWLRADLD